MGFIFFNVMLTATIFFLIPYQFHSLKFSRFKFEPNFYCDHKTGHNDHCSHLKGHNISIVTIIVVTMSENWLCSPKISIVTMFCLFPLLHEVTYIPGEANVLADAL